MTPAFFRPWRPSRSLLSALALGTLLVTSAAAARRAGTPDPLFGTAGLTRVDLDTYLEVARIAQQPDGKTVAACRIWKQIDNNSSPHFGLVRFLPNGLLDTGFGTSGVLMEDLGDLSNSQLYGWASNVQVDGQGRILATGGVGNDESAEFALIRYLADGSRDPSFGVGGKVTGTSGPFSDVFQTAIQPDGKILAAGSSTLNTTRSIMLRRYLEDGTPDPDFGVSGQVVNTGGVPSAIDTVAVLPSGKIVAGGWIDNDACVLQYLANGTLDTSFGTGGKVVVDVRQGYDYFSRLVIQGNGRIVAGGRTYTSEDDFTEHAFLVRLTDQGQLDRSFGKKGLALGPKGAEVQDLVLQNDGRLVVAGASSDHFAVSRFTPAGKPDRSFGKNGVAVLPTTSTGHSDALLLDAQGNIVAAGHEQAGAPFETNLLITRLLPR